MMALVVLVTTMPKRKKEEKSAAQNLQVQSLYFFALAT
jgi:hypothetical protein